jgi:hypothetical protein
MKLHENQLKLLRHLSQFEALDYPSCLRMLDTERANDLVKLSYAFRPLTKNKYAAKRKDGAVTILAKGRNLFPDIQPLVTAGGGAAGMKRLCAVARVAALLGEHGVRSFVDIQDMDEAYFIPSACWRKIRPGILSTTRFAGILFIGAHRLAVYDIGDGAMEWQSRAERSLFYWNFFANVEYETRATGMLFICDDGKRVETAQSIIRVTMWNRKQLMRDSVGFERTRPVQYVKAPIKLNANYERVYLTTPELLARSLTAICEEDDYIVQCRGESPKCREKEGDYEDWPYRYFVNIATDLLKYVYYFAAMKSLANLRKMIAEGPYPDTELNYAIILSEQDFAILRMYPDMKEIEGARFFAYKHPEDR